MSEIPTTTPPEVDVPDVLNVAVEYVDGAVAAGHGERVAYIHEGRRVTYAELQRSVNQVGNALAALGIELEQRVAILLPNCLEFVTSFFGAIKIGAVSTPISFAVTPDEQTFLLADSRARAIVTAAALWGPIRERRGRCPFLRHVLLVGGGASQPGPLAAVERFVISLHQGLGSAGYAVEAFGVVAPAPIMAWLFEFGDFRRFTQNVLVALPAACALAVAAIAALSLVVTLWIGLRVKRYIVTPSIDCSTGSSSWMLKIVCRSP